VVILLFSSLLSLLFSLFSSLSLLFSSLLFSLFSLFSSLLFSLSSLLFSSLLSLFSSLLFSLHYLTHMKVLYLEDENLLGRIVKESLESRDCEIDWFTDGHAAKPALEAADKYDIAVLDVQLPGEDGFTIGQRLRERFPTLPILYLTARVQAKDVLTGFEAGGNDYVRKPFSMEELLVRMQNLVQMRKGGPASTAPGQPNNAPAAAPKKPFSETYEFGQFTFDYPNLRLHFHPPGDEVTTHQLSHREAELLRLFVRLRGQSVIQRKRILLDLWHDDGFFNSRNLDVYVRKLRSMLEADPQVRIITLRGVGYRFVVE
jgi:DNA-binding response OmpR family regulator